MRAIYCALAVIVAVTMTGCFSSPQPQENVDFRNKTGINLTFVKRGVYSLYKSNGDNGFESFWNKLAKNEISFFMNEDQEQFAILHTENGQLAMTINNLYFKYDMGSNNALMTAALYSIGLIQTGGTDTGTIEERFYNTPMLYSKSGYDVSALINDDLFTQKKFKITEDAILVKM